MNKWMNPGVILSLSSMCVFAAESMKPVALLPQVQAGETSLKLPSGSMPLKHHSSQSPLNQLTHLCFLVSEAIFVAMIATIM